MGCLLSIVLDTAPNVPRGIDFGFVRDFARQHRLQSDVQTRSEWRTWTPGGWSQAGGATI
eukprot:1394178-Amorphochlora_amoeboformis.AAC.2